MIMTSFTIVKSICAYLPKSHVHHRPMNISFRLNRSSFHRIGTPVQAKAYIHARYLGLLYNQVEQIRMYIQMRKYYAGIISLLKRFYACSYEVKWFLVRSYISNMYCGQF